MKYIKRFNESKEDQVISELMELCNDSITWLKDDNYEIRWTSYKCQRGHIKLQFSKTDDHIDDLWYWSDVKDDLIPFIQILMNKYKVTNILFTDDEKVHTGAMWEHKEKYVDINKVINDDFQDKEIYNNCLTDIMIVINIDSTVPNNWLPYPVWH